MPERLGEGGDLDILLKWCPHVRTGHVPLSIIFRPPVHYAVVVHIASARVVVQMIEGLAAATIYIVARDLVANARAGGLDCPGVHEVCETKEIGGEGRVGEKKIAWQSIAGDNQERKIAFGEGGRNHDQEQRGRDQ